MMIPEQLRIAPDDVKEKLRLGLEQVENSLQGDGLETQTIEDAKYLVSSNPVNNDKIEKAYRWWARNERFLDAPENSPADVAANLWGGRPGKDWFYDLYQLLQEKSSASIDNMSTKETHYKVLDGNYIQAEESETHGFIKAIVSVFNNIDLANEVVLPGAYSKSIQRKLPAAVWNHNWSSPIAKTIEAIELLPGDPRLPEELSQYGGLFISAEFPLEVEESRQAYLKLKNGLVDEFSVGYRVVEAYEENDVIYLKELDLLEWSAVMRGANPITKLIEVKNLTFQDHTDLTLSQLNNYIDRYESLAEKRQKLSSNHISNLETLLGRISTLIDTNKPPQEELPTPDVVKPSKKAYAIELLNFLSEDTE